MTDDECQALLAEKAARAGDRDTAIDHWRQLLAIDPHNAKALNAIGSWELGHNNALEAVLLLDRANLNDPGQPAILFNLAAAHRAAGSTARAISSLRLAIAADPYFVQGIFQLAVLYEEAGDVRSAAEAYRNFLAVAPAEIAGDARFSQLISRAEVAVARDNRALEKMIGLAATERSARVAEAINAFVGGGRIYQSEPTFFHIPRLPAIPFFERADTPWLDGFEAHSAAITDEVSQFVGSNLDEAFRPYVEFPAGAPLNQWEELDRSRNWSALHLWRHGVLDNEIADRLPATMNALRGVPLLHLKDRGPNVFLSMLQPGTKIPPHTGVTNARSTVHLALVVPPQCGFRVGAETRNWEAGKAWVFDDTIEHEAWNESIQARLILIFDIWHPMLNADEQRQIASIFAAYDSYYGKNDGSLDRF